MGGPGSGRPGEPGFLKKAPKGWPSKIRQIRLESGMDQFDFAERLGYSRKSKVVTRFETGAQRIPETVKLLLRYIDTFGYLDDE